MTLFIPGKGVTMIPATEAMALAKQIEQKAREGRCAARLLADNPGLIKHAE